MNWPCRAINNSIMQQQQQQQQQHPPLHLTVSASSFSEAAALTAPGGAEHELAMHVYGNNKLIHHSSILPRLPHHPEKRQC